MCQRVNAMVVMVEEIEVVSVLELQDLQEEIRNGHLQHQSYLMVEVLDRVNHMLVHLVDLVEVEREHLEVLMVQVILELLGREMQVDKVMVQMEQVEVAAVDRLFMHLRPGLLQRRQRLRPPLRRAWPSSSSARGRGCWTGS